jgi:cell shape-determining protein MreD
MAAPEREERPPAGWTAGLLFDVLMPAIVGIAILLFLAAVFIASSANYPGL